MGYKDHKGKKCNCDECNKCCEEEVCGCKLELSTNCVRYEGKDLTCLDITKGERLESILGKIDEAVCKIPEDPCINGEDGEDGAPGIDGQDGAPGAPGPANSLSIGTVTTGTAAATITGTVPSQILNLVLPTATGTTNYFAWADDNMGGTGFTLTPSDTCYMAITDTVATVGSPVASDFSGKWFRINKPTKHLEAALYLGNTDYTINGINNPITPFTPAPLPMSVPGLWHGGINSYTVFTVDLKLFTTAASDSMDIGGDINGTLIPLVTLPNTTGIDVIRANCIIEVYRKDTGNIKVIVTANVDSNSSSSQVQIFETDMPLLDTTLLDFTVSGYYNDSSITGTLNILSQRLKSFNPDIMTC